MVRLWQAGRSGLNKVLQTECMSVCVSIIWVVLSPAKWKAPPFPSLFLSLSFSPDTVPVAWPCNAQLGIWFGNALQSSESIKSNGPTSGPELGGSRKTLGPNNKTAPGRKRDFEQSTLFCQQFIWRRDSNIKRKSPSTITPL